MARFGLRGIHLCPRSVRRARQRSCLTIRSYPLAFRSTRTGVPFVANRHKLCRVGHEIVPHVPLPRASFRHSVSSSSSGKSGLLPGRTNWARSQVGPQTIIGILVLPGVPSGGKLYLEQQARATVAHRLRSRGTGCRQHSSTPEFGLHVLHRQPDTPYCEQRMHMGRIGCVDVTKCPIA